MNSSFHFSEDIKEKVIQIIFFVFLAAALFLSCSAFALGSLPLLIFGVLPCGFILAALFIRIYLPKIGNWVGFSFIFPKKYLKKAPPMLSPFAGMLNDERYEEAVAGLTPLLKIHPENAEVVLMYAKACMNLDGFQQKGLDEMNRYFSGSDRGESQQEIQLLFYFAEKSAEFRSREFVIPILERELLRDHYTELEKKAINARLNALRR